MCIVICSSRTVVDLWKQLTWAAAALGQERKRGLAVPATGTKAGHLETRPVIMSRFYQLIVNGNEQRTVRLWVLNCMPARLLQTPCL
jgi:hypothetical protein